MTVLLFEPDHADCAVAPSPNFNARRTGPVDLLLLHYTGMSTGEEAQRRLCDADAQVSSHYIVHENGAIVQLVPEEQRAWHAGASSWHGETDVNSRSIGIEIVNKGHDGGLPDYADAQIEQVIALCAGIIERHDIPAHRVLGHSDVAPQRKEDPGEKFPWHQLAQAGIGLWVKPTPVSGGRFFMCGEVGQPIEALQAMLALYGYDVPVNGSFCDRTAAVVTAFQRHFRPVRVDGVADMSTIDTLHRLLYALPENIT